MGSLPAVAAAARRARGRRGAGTRRRARRRSRPPRRRRRSRARRPRRRRPRRGAARRFRRARPARARPPRRAATALAGTPTPWLRASVISAEAKPPMWARRAGGERDAHLAGAARLVDFGADQPHRCRRPCPATPGRAQLGRHADGEARQRLLGRFRLEIDRAVLDDAEQRLARAADRRAEPRRAAADDAGDRRLHFGLRELAPASSRRSPSRDLRSASATASAFWADGELGARRCATPSRAARSSPRR